MGAKLQALIELQDVELQIIDIRRQLERKQRMVAAQAAKVESLARALEQERQEIRRTQADFDELDLEIKSRSASIARHREQLNSVRTNKEYAAVLSQLNTEKADLSKLEARALEMMERVEARKRALADQERTYQAQVEQLEQLRAQLEEARSMFAARLASLQQRREASAARVDRESLALFNRASERYEGEVMARLVRVHPRRDEFVCEGCHMSLQLEVANALRTRDELITCGNCGRILYLDQGN